MAATLASTYAPEAKAEIVDHVLGQIAIGRALTRILTEDEGMPNVTTMFDWMNKSPELSQQVERAREIGATTILEEIVTIADTENMADTQRAKLRVYAREKYAQMIAPRRYGNKLDLTSGGEKLEPGQVNDNRLQAIVGVVAQRKAAKALPKPEEETPDES